MTSASRTIKDGSITLPKAESVDTSRHSLNHVRQLIARRLEKQPGDIADFIVFNTPIILVSLSTAGM
jgi:hypothetical protein